MIYALKKVCGFAKSFSESIKQGIRAGETPLLQGMRNLQKNDADNRKADNLRNAFERTIKQGATENIPIDKYH